MDYIIKPQLEKYKRILVTSDVHGNYKWLQRLLLKAEFCDDDALIIIGDIIDKGKESLKTLQYIMELEKRENVYVLLGNVDFGRICIIDNNTKEGREYFVEFVYGMKKIWGGSIFEDMFIKEGLAPDKLSLENADFYKEIISKRYKEEFDFLRNRPVFLETEKYIFVHAGVHTDELCKIDLTDIHKYLSRDYFLNEEHNFKKYIVVGHYPVSLYPPHFNNNPIIDFNKKIISIDGGCAIKREGQLNLVIIPGILAEPSEIIYIYEDYKEKARVLDDQTEKHADANIIWGNNKVEIIDKKDDTALIRQISTGKELIVAASYLYGDNMCEDTNDSFIGVKKGDIVSILEETKKGTIVKKNGVTGWYFGRLEKISF